MRKSVITWGLSVAGVGTLAFGILGSSSVASPAHPSRSQDGAQPTALRVSERGSTEVTTPVGLGLVTTEVPTELAAHLGLAAGEGVLIASVRAGTPAAAAGLKRHDVILRVDGATAFPPNVRVALGNGGLALAIVRGGIELSVALQAGQAERSAAEFFSTDSLRPEHPFRRLGELEALKQSYSSEADRYGELIRDLEQERRATREEAQRAMAELQEEIQAQIAQALAQRQDELLARWEQGLPAERIEPLREFRLELERHLPQERTQALGEGLATLFAELQALPGERVRSGDEQGQAANRAHQRFQRIGNESANLLTERVGRAWTSSMQELPQHHQRLGQKHDERMQWTEQTLAKIRSEVQGRITCAIDRARDELARQLRQRLQRMEVPAPGELEAALEDVYAQLDALTERFIARTEDALALYEEELAAANGALVPALGQHLAASESAASNLAVAIGAVVERALPGELVVDGSWPSRGRVDAAVDVLSVELRRTIDAGRDDLRVGSVGLTNSLREQKVVSDDAWRDLKTLLHGIQSEASSDCWKLDGPHLDGRFPREKKEAGPRGEVAMIAR